MAAQTRTFFVFSTFGPDKPVSTVKKKRNGEGRGGIFSRQDCSKIASRKEALFKGGREVLKGAKEGVSPSIKKCF